MIERPTIARRWNHETRMDQLTRSDELADSAVIREVDFHVGIAVIDRTVLHLRKKLSVRVASAPFVETENTSEFNGGKRSSPPLGWLALNAVFVHHHRVMCLEARDLVAQQIDELFRGGKLVGSRTGNPADTR